jgi:REP element-mobilizing transposase RayT
MNLAPLYTAENCKPAFQLRWSLACFSRNTLFLPPDFQKQINALAERHGVRVLEAFQSSDTKFQLLISSIPKLPPSKIVKLAKGSMQHVLRLKSVVSLSRNFRLVATGAANLSAAENYVSSQLEHHPLASSFSMERMKSFCLRFDNVDLSQPIQSSHGQYVIGLHLVFVHAQRWRTANEDFHLKTQAAILATAQKRRHRISRVSILPDHTHITLGFGYEECPEDLAFSYMNNIAFMHGMQPFLMHSYYSGTIGPYNMNAIRERLRVEEAAVAG